MPSLFIPLAWTQYRRADLVAGGEELRRAERQARSSGRPVGGQACPPSAAVDIDVAGKRMT